MSGSCNRCDENFSTVANEALNNFKEPNTKEWLAVNHEYDALIHWFADITERKEWTAAKVRVGGLAVYGWMPRMLRAYGTGSIVKGEDPSQIFSKVACYINEGNLEDIPKDFLNRSFVGTSKFLHFCFPEEYAIWDSKVHKALKWPGITNSKENCCKYQKFILKFCEGNEEKLSLRKVESALFLYGKPTP